MKKTDYETITFATAHGIVDLWRESAALEGVSLEQWIANACNGAVQRSLFTAAPEAPASKKTKPRRGSGRAA